MSDLLLKSISALSVSYEGLCREDVPHGKGVMIMGNGSGGGFQTTSKGDTSLNLVHVWI